MSKRYTGGVISTTSPSISPAGTSGVFTLAQQFSEQGVNNWPPYKIEEALRFRSSASAQLNKTLSVAGNRRTWTWSAWVKRGTLSAISDRQVLFGGYGAANDTDWFEFGWGGSSDGYDEIYCTTNTYNASSAAVYRDPSAWYHIVYVVDTTQSTQSNRIKVYINGSQITFDVSSYTPVSSQNAQLGVNGAWNHNIAKSPSGSSRYFDGYMCEINFVDGQALTPSSFGATDKDGIWVPKLYTGAYGTNGFYLNFRDGTSATTMGYDYSGNSNNWTLNGFNVSTANTTYDIVVDVPEDQNDGTAFRGRGNYCTFNPLDNGGNTVSNGNLVVNTAVGFDLIRSTMFVSSGKWYWEITCDDTGEGYLGISSAAESLTQRGGETADSAVVRATNGDLRTNSVNSAYGSAVADGNIMMFALDMDSGKFWAGKNGTWFNSGNPAAGTNAGKTGLTVAVSPSVSVYDNEDYTANFGQQPFAYTPPSGFKALNTFNLPDPTIKQPNQYFDATLYTGTGSSQNITNSGSMQPDFVWVKKRSGIDNHELQDAVRGATKRLASNTTDAEATVAGSISSFNSNGFTVVNAGTTNENGFTYVGWQWRASNAAGVTNTSGSVTSTVSANQTAGLSIATFTCPSSGTNFTVGHGLGAAPAMFILKTRSVVDGWYVYHKSLTTPASNYLALNSTAAVASSTSIWGNTNPTSTVLTLGANAGIAYSATGVLYSFAEIAGYSAFGRYTGNGSADGPFVYLGFKPKFILIRRSDIIAGWKIYNTSNLNYNPINTSLEPHDAGAEATSTNFNMDLVSNGFKLRTTYADFNTNGGNYIYAAFAETPFKYARAR